MDHAPHELLSKTQKGHKVTTLINSDYIRRLQSVNPGLVVVNGYATPQYLVPIHNWEFLFICGCTIILYKWLPMVTSYNHSTRWLIPPAGNSWFPAPRHCQHGWAALPTNGWSIPWCRDPWWVSVLVPVGDQVMDTWHLDAPWGCHLLPHLLPHLAPSGSLRLRFWCKEHPETRNKMVKKSSAWAILK